MHWGYRWQEPKKGQYADGHERPDVVWERDKVFIPKNTRSQGSHATL